MEVRLLGGFQVLRDGRTLPPPPTRKTLFLMAYLAMLEGRPTSREALCSFLWSNRSEGQARGSLRQALGSLKRLYDDAVVVDGDSIALAWQCLTVDAISLLAAADSDDPAEQTNAAHLYGGPFLAGHDAPDQGAEDWLHVHRSRIHRAALLLVERLANAPLSAPAVQETTAEFAQKLLTHDLAAEEAHRALMQLALSEGKTTAALRQYEVCCNALHRMLGAKPEAKTRELMERARAGPDKEPTADPDFRPERTTAMSRSGPSIAVLQFENRSDPADDALVDGTVEEITGALARMRDFFVIARQSAYAFKGQALDVRDIGARLGVRYLLEGSVQRSDKRVRLAAQLIDAESGVQLWAERFDGELEDMFAFQDLISERVAGALHPSLRAAEIERARKKPPDVLEAYDLVMRAYPHLWAHTQSDNAAAIALLDRALVCDSRYGLAMALLAWCHAQEAAYLWSKDPAASHETSLRLARRAAMQVEDDATALASIGAAETMCSGDLDLANSFIERALRLDPNHAWAWLRSGYLHFYARQFDDALDHFDRALSLSPLDPFAFNIYVGMGVANAEMGNYGKAIQLVEKGIHARPGMSWGYRALAYVAAAAGELEKARQAMAVFLAAHPEITVAKMQEAMPKPMLGKARYWECMRRLGVPER